MVSVKQELKKSRVKAAYNWICVEFRVDMDARILLQKVERLLGPDGKYEFLLIFKRWWLQYFWNQLHEFFGKQLFYGAVSGFKGQTEGGKVAGMIWSRKEGHSMAVYSYREQ